MSLADHLRPLLRDHDCVIIPDFGGLVAEYTPARVQPGGRHVLSPPTRQVAFNQALTRNDGLLVDALCQLGLPTAEAREAVRVAVAALHHELQAQQRTELPGIGVFRQVAGRGLQFEYTGTDNLLAAAFGLPELTAHPVRATDVRLAREQQAQLVPRLRSAGQGLRWRRLLPGASIGLLAGLAVAGLYLLNLHPTALPTAWRGYLPHWEQGASPVPTQQAALAQPSLSSIPAVVSAPAMALPAVEDVTPVVGQAPVATTEAASPQPQLTSAEPELPPVERPVEEASLDAIAPTTAALGEGATVMASLPQQVVRQTLAPMQAVLPQPVSRRRKGKIPAAAIPVAADESNVARPIPLAMRLAANTAAKAPAAPKVAPVPPAATTPAPTVAAPAPVVAHAPAALPIRPVINKTPGKTLAMAPAKLTAAKPASAQLLAAKPAPAKLIVAKPASAQLIAVKTAPAKLLSAKPAPAKLAPAKPVAPLPMASAAGAATAAGTTIKGRTGRYYVVVAAFGSLARAEQSRRNLAQAGRSAKIIIPPAGSRFYRLSAADFADRPSAALAARRLRQNPNFDKGLTVYPY